MCAAALCTEETKYPLAQRCNPALIAKDVLPLGNTIELLFKDEEQVQTYTALRLNATRVQDDFECGVKLGDSEEIKATAHFRGKARGSLQCKRKSLTVELNGKRTRRIMPQAASDRFILLSVRASCVAHASTDQSQSLNRNISHPPANHSPSIGTYHIHRPIAVPR
eukprot:1177896-Prorocentrum_minimum.AAC.1